MTEWQFTYRVTGNSIFVRAERWYDARHFAEMHFACDHSDIRWHDSSLQAFEDRQAPTFEFKWHGRAAGASDRTFFTVTEVKRTVKSTAKSKSNGKHVQR